jgi:hypothetical protein
MLVPHIQKYLFPISYVQDKSKGYKMFQFGKFDSSWVLFEKLIIFH